MKTHQHSSTISSSIEPLFHYAPSKNLGALGAALYIHWPFCARKCPYCDFNSHVRDQINEQSYANALCDELDHIYRRYPRLKLHSIFFGGGTPSLMDPKTVDQILRKTDSLWGIHSDLEITLEANPSSVEADRFAGYLSAGVNRLSLGIQAMNDADLKFLGRLHNSKQALYALETARSVFDRVSFDLIYARPHQTVESWAAELQSALAFDPSHLSLYQLTIEEGTAFYYQYHRGQFTLPDEEESLALFNATQDITEAAGLPAYEISNHAKIGQESRHNLAYWQGLPYIGIGPGAHGRLPASDYDQTGQMIATAGIKRPEDWMKQQANTGVGYETIDPVSNSERLTEMILMGLRLRSGLSITTVEDRLKLSARDFINIDKATYMIKEGFLAAGDDNSHDDNNSNKRVTTLRLTAKGRPLLNHILDQLLC